MTTAFRAEPSSGPLHLAEFLMPEWELVGGSEDCTLERNMAVAQTVLQYVFHKVLYECKDEIEYLEQYRKTDLGETKKHKLTELAGRKKSMKKKEFVMEKQAIEKDYERKISSPPLADRLTKYASSPFVVTTHAECVRLMLQHEAEGRIKFDETPAYSDDFTKQHEFYITEVLYGGMPVFVRFYPKAIKAFYMPLVDSSKVLSAGDSVEYVDCYDLLFPYVGEVVGGSQRIDDTQTLIDRMAELGMDTTSESELDWYIDLRRDASLPHGGAGLGFGRMMIAITGVPNIRDLQEFPRAYSLSCRA
jgi:aspartyl/asparaginyl-tRNA synthetase